MIGYLLNFYKYSLSNISDNQTNENKFVRSVVWSTFDRIEVRAIDEFAKYRLSEFGEKNWIGERQFAMIYEFLDNYAHLKYEQKEDECEFAFDSIDGSKKFRFFGITLIDFEPEIHSYFYGNHEKKQPGAKIYTLLRKAVDSIIRENEIAAEDIAYEVYGVLGGQDAAIIWLAYQFEDIAKIVEGVRKSKTRNKREIIANVSTIIGLKNVNDEEISYDDVKGKLHIKLTKRAGYNAEKFAADLKQAFGEESKRELCSLFGEHDLMVSIDGSNLVAQLYKRNGIFNPKSKGFRNNFIQSKTEITMENTYDHIIGYEFPVNISTDNENQKRNILTDEKRKRYVEKIEEIAGSKCFENAAYLQETLWLLYEDFMKNMMSSFSYPWSSDLDYQFENCLDYLDAVVKSDMEKKQRYDNIQILISSMRQMVLHVAQANRIFFEIPNTHLKHTGGYSKILHTYYGIVKQYLCLAYSIPRYDKQSLIVPFISFDVTPIAKSEFCASVRGFNNKIIRIRLPYEALVDISKYTKLLAHELFHYIAPANRVERNLLVAFLSFAIEMGQMAKLYFEESVAPFLSEFPNNSEMENPTESEEWKNRFTEISREVQARALRIPDLPERFQIWVKDYKEDDEWTEYFDKLGRAFIQGLKEKSGISEWLWELIESVRTLKTEDKITVKLVKTARREDFYSWLIHKHPIDRVKPVDVDMRYSLREALADHFMIQAAGMDIGEYVKYVYKHKDIISDEPENIKQKFRVALVIEHYQHTFMGERIDTKSKPANEIYIKIFGGLKNNRFELEDEICDWAAKNYAEFAVAFNIYNELFERYFNLFDFGKYNNEDYYPDFFHCYQELKDLLNTDSNKENDPKKKEFKKKIYYIENFQHQKELRALSGALKNIPPKDRPSFKADFLKDSIDGGSWKLTDANVPVIVENITELFNVIKIAVEKVKEEGENVPIWFRGHEDSGYLLIPSLYRMKNKINMFYDVSMRKVLRSLIDLFKAKAYNAPELIGNGNGYDTNCLITMQHYSVPTNIMDWTASAFIALYFALEKEINGEEIKKRIDASIYVLNPIRLNIAGKLLRDGYEQRRMKEELEFPIMALVEDDKKFGEYIPMQLDAQEKPKKGVEYPLAVYAPFVNQRIKAQLGTFTIFGLDNEGEKINDDKLCAKDYSEFSLKKVQETYKKMCESDLRGDLEYKPFLAEVRISADTKQEIADSLRAMGIGKANIYPELEKIAGELTDEVKRYFDMDENN